MLNDLKLSEKLAVAREWLRRGLSGDVDYDLSGRGGSKLVELLDHSTHEATLMEGNLLVKEGSLIAAEAKLAMIEAEHVLAPRPDTRPETVRGLNVVSLVDAKKGNTR